LAFLIPWLQRVEARESYANFLQSGKETSMY
jgi:hypothetical protein